MKQLLSVSTLVLLLSWGASAGCKDTASPQELPAVADPVVGAKADRVGRPLPPPTRVIGGTRLMAFGDVHGDLDATRDLLLGIGVIDEDDHWIADDLVVVQVGDQLDRGDGEREILALFDQLADEAHSAGGAFYSLLGNHEVMNAQLDFRYVTAGGWRDFADVPYDASDALYDDYPEDQRGRVAAFRPGGPYARRLAQHNTVMVVDRTVFVHGGLMPHHVTRGLADINAEVRRWLNGDAVTEPELLNEDDGPFWSRVFSDDDETDDDTCAVLGEVLDALDADQMVVGHTVQPDGITSACEGQVWRVDVGLAAHYGGSPFALEMDDDAIYIVEVY